MKLNDEIKTEKVAPIAPKKTAKSVGAELALTLENLDKLIPEWKKKHARLFKNTIDGETVIWRPIKRSEYRQLLDLESSEEENRLLAKQEQTVKMAVLFPANIDELIEAKAGLATVLSEEILANSGFDISKTESL